MTQNLVVHIGDAKAGSTSLQAALSAGVTLGTGERVFFPLPPGGENHNALALSLLTGSTMSRQRREALWQRLAGSLRQTRSPLTVISGELFELVEPKLLRDTITRYLPGHAAHLRLIAYVRPHHERLLSSFAEFTKIGDFSGTVEAMHSRLLREKRLPYMLRFSRWREVFGDAFTLRPMIAAELVQGDVVTDFLAQIGSTLDNAKRTKLNPSPSMAELMAIRCYLDGCGQLPTWQIQDLGRRFAALMVDGDAATRRVPPRLHHALANDLITAYRDDAAALDATFFTGRPMSGALLACAENAPAVPQSANPADYLTRDAMRALFAAGSLQHERASRPIPLARFLTPFRPHLRGWFGRQ